MSFSLHLHPVFLSSSRFWSQPKPTNRQILRKSPSLNRPLASAQNNNGTSNIKSDAKSAIIIEEALLPAPLRRELMPKHVAVIMDGNRRWAKMRGLPVAFGYEAGFRAFKNLVDLCSHWGITALTVFAFSSENWSRPKVEVDLLIGLFKRVLENEFEKLARTGVRLSVIGDSSKLPRLLQDLIENTVNTTKENSGLHLLVAVNYSGQYDVVQACQTIAQKAKDGDIEPKDINSFLVEQELQTNCTDFPCPDLLIRTSGELRLSNFLLWQLAYTEFFFSYSHWPDFGEAEFLEALCSFQQRQRRYGKQSS